jgi:hypothetical protein
MGMSETPMHCTSQCPVVPVVAISTEKRCEREKGEGTLNSSGAVGAQCRGRMKRTDRKKSNKTEDV